MQRHGLATSFKGNYPIYVLFITNCFSIPNLFACKELVGREGNVWLYRPNLREKVQLPVGSCELALPMRGRELAYNGNAPREAYATILHSAHVYDIALTRFLLFAAVVVLSSFSTELLSPLPASKHSGLASLESICKGTITGKILRGTREKKPTSWRPSLALPNNVTGERLFGRANSSSAFASLYSLIGDLVFPQGWHKITVGLTNSSTLPEVSTVKSKLQHRVIETEFRVKTVFLNIIELHRFSKHSGFWALSTYIFAPKVTGCNFGEICWIVGSSVSRARRSAASNALPV
ncbi:hypothetical protein KIW84_070801 [Lathyrus oleraceus]|uniref:Uncharacterized protein n=1 Tax=Pisum sativum TaxID=3888 RepID=A0A9D4ZSD2_PEA|nr:hypothetical protein KIW84_070801 [Pisum sativum]